MWEAAANDDDVVMGNSAQGESNTKDEGANSARNIEELKRKTLAVPSGYNNSPCAICKEPFERRFNEDEEDWQFVNAVEVDGTIYHATCNANQTRSIGLLPSPVDSTSGNQ
ncbi:mRNA 3' end processing factor [Kickxella alabastrina]|uniref:mRNA 3' end processing factor n=1 Tax=Kickxella alabastrina TaxID=61397 RepID=A0ACC1ICF4_9FUNG|nr:mRNA 3' end processing factor [Kickxella alabastrina]